MPVQKKKASPRLSKGEKKAYSTLESVFAKLDAAGISEAQVWESFSTVYSSEGQDRVSPLSKKRGRRYLKKVWRSLEGVKEDIESLRRLLGARCEGDGFGTIERGLKLLTMYVKFFLPGHEMAGPRTVAAGRMTELGLFRYWCWAVKATGPRRKFTKRDFAVLLAQGKSGGGWWRDECEPNLKEDDVDHLTRVENLLGKRLRRAQKVSGKKS